MKTTQSKIILAVILVCVIAGVGYAFFGTDSGTTITAEITTATKGKVTTMVTATGTIEPLTEVEVGTQVSGEVEKIYVDYNSTVTKGQLLAELDKTNLIAALQQANASYSNAVTQRDYYNKIYSRQKKLYEEEVISQADFDDAEYNFNNSKISVTQALSDLQEAKTNLSYADIYSPIDGVVLSKEVDEGQTVAASFETPTLFTIAKDLKEMQVEADVDEADIGNVAEGQRVSFTVDAYQGETFTGTVTQVRLDPTEEESVITYTVVIKADNPDLKLKPGLTATVSIYTLELDDVLTTEAKAVNFNPALNEINTYYKQQGIDKVISEIPKVSEGKSRVWQYAADGSLKPVEVTLGASDGINIEVKSGLQAGTKLVYNLKTVTASESGAEDSSSPFMPKPPGKK
ncbi:MULTISPECIES: efflux RND transporter periplasmic adaptor subunit [Leeuwenhoekiella]|uniref:efflux RND transporter periplasmic adaptor subunit n=1 Tax=Leeuwenhoekiella TaxID=283735 RepID=UPI001431E7E8|nr:efflux RND transporter periplasmic adaptor subunit [Leeuwenhoekiella sp. ZYFB001]